MSARTLIAIFIAAAMFLAPLGLQSGAAMAMAPADHQSEMMAKGHCGQESGQSHEDGKTGKSCCVAMCAAVAVAPAAPVEPDRLLPVKPAIVAVAFRVGTVSELPTPPPRGA